MDNLPNHYKEEFTNAKDKGTVYINVRFFGHNTDSPKIMNTSESIPQTSKLSPIEYTYILPKEDLELLLSSSNAPLRGLIGRVFAIWGSKRPAATVIVTDVSRTKPQRVIDADIKLKNIVIFGEISPLPYMYDVITASMEHYQDRYDANLIQENIKDSINRRKIDKFIIDNFHEDEVAQIKESLHKGTLTVDDLLILAENN